MTDNSFAINLKEANDLYRRNQLIKILNEADNFLMSGDTDDSRVESVHIMRTSARRIIEVSSDYRHFLNITKEDYLEKAANALISATGRARNLDVFWQFLVNIANNSELNLGISSRKNLSDFIDWITDNRLKAYKHITKEMQEKGLYYRIQKAYSKQELQRQIATKKTKVGNHTLTEAAPAMFYRKTAEILAARKEKSCLHKLRIECKGFRYMLELFELGGLNSSKCSESFRIIQDTLGQWHDYFILSKTYSKYCKNNGRKCCDEVLMAYFIELESLSRHKAEEMIMTLNLNWFNQAYAKISDQSS